MLPHARPLLGAVLAAAALAAAGCGSSSSEQDTTRAAAPKAAATTATPAPDPAPAAATGPRPTKAVFVRRADKVCLQAREVSQSANAVVQKAFAAKDLNKAAEAIDNYTPLFAKHMTELKALRQPKADAQILAGLIKVMDSQVQALRDEATALRQQDNATLQQVSKAQQTELQFADELGKQYGFRVCGRAAA